MNFLPQLFVCVFLTLFSESFPFAVVDDNKIVVILDIRKLRQISKVRQTFRNTLQQIKRSHCKPRMDNPALFALLSLMESYSKTPYMHIAIQFQGL